MCEILLCQDHPWQCWGEQTKLVCEKNGDNHDLNEMRPIAGQVARNYFEYELTKLMYCKVSQ